MLEAAPYVRAIGFVISGALFWLLYFDFKDRLRPEPRRLLLAAFALGGGAAVLGLAAYRLAAALGAPEYPGPGSRSVLLFCLLLVGPIEEGAKFAVARLSVFRWSAFDEPIDGLVYAAAVAIGFASVENLLHAPLIGWPEQVARAVASPLTHSLFSAVWGFGAGHALVRSRSSGARIAWIGGTLLAAMLAHGAYDAFLLAFGGTYPASALALVLWIGLIVQARRLR